jgi:hypothetical protein
MKIRLISKMSICSLVAVAMTIASARAGDEKCPRVEQGPGNGMAVPGCSSTSSGEIVELTVEGVDRAYPHIAALKVRGAGERFEYALNCGDENVPDMNYLEVVQYALNSGIYTRYTSDEIYPIAPDPALSVLDWKASALERCGRLKSLIQLYATPEHPVFVQIDLEKRQVTGYRR